MPQCPNAPMRQCANAPIDPMPHCPNAPMPKCANAPMRQAPNAPMTQWISLQTLYLPTSPYISRQHRAQVARRSLVEAHASHGAVVLGGRCGGIEQPRAGLECALEIEAIDVEDVVDGDLRALAAAQRRDVVDAPQARFHAREVLRGDQVDLVEEQPVGEGHLGRYREMPGDVREI